MQRTSSSTLAVWAVIGTVLAVVVDVVLESQGFSLPGLPWFAIIGMLVLAAILLVLGWPIKTMERR
jgi:protein-S-isoprenylcysteine O-methyltransferase Ste14